MSPFFQPRPPWGGVFCRGGGAISANMALVVVLMKDLLVPGHFRLFSVTVPYQGLPLPYNGKSAYSESVSANLRRSCA